MPWNPLNKRVKGVQGCSEDVLPLPGLNLPHKDLINSPNLVSSSSFLFLFFTPSILLVIPKGSPQQFLMDQPSVVNSGFHFSLTQKN